MFIRINPVVIDYTSVNKMHRNSVSDTISVFLRLFYFFSLSATAPVVFEQFRQTVVEPQDFGRHSLAPTTSQSRQETDLLCLANFRRRQGDVVGEQSEG